VVRQGRVNTKRAEALNCASLASCDPRTERRRRG
jgi:hypothetical protein